jgi:nitrogenase molybdenum-cofactor synthesis protein NifE
MSEALYEVAKYFGNNNMMNKAIELVRDEVSTLLTELEKYKKALKGKKAAV